MSSDKSTMQSKQLERPRLVRNYHHNITSELVAIRDNVFRPTMSPPSSVSTQDMSSDNWLRALAISEHSIAFREHEAAEVAVSTIQRQVYLDGGVESLLVLAQERYAKAGQELTAAEEKLRSF